MTTCRQNWRTVSSSWPISGTQTGWVLACMMSKDQVECNPRPALVLDVRTALASLSPCQPPWPKELCYTLKRPSMHLDWSYQPAVPLHHCLASAVLLGTVVYGMLLREASHLLLKVARCLKTQQGQCLAKGTRRSIIRVQAIRRLKAGSLFIWQRPWQRDFDCQ